MLQLKNSAFKFGSLLLAVLLALALSTPSSLADEAAPIPDWVGNMFPAGYSENIVTKGETFTVYTQVYKQGTTEASGQGEGIACTLYWGEVSRFSGEWEQVIETPMTYSGDIGNNDEYRAEIQPGAGQYEFTTRCSSTTTSIVRWQNRGNGRLTVSPFPDAPLDRRALWVEKGIIAWNNPDGATYELHYAPDGELLVPVRSGNGIPLEIDRVLTWRSYQKFPTLNGYDAWRLPESALDNLHELLSSELAIAAYDTNGKILDTTGVQLQGVLDDVYAYDGELGVVYRGDVPTLKVWAPTAKSVALKRFADPNLETAAVVDPMSFDPETGVWSISGDSSWDRQFYLYDVEVYAPNSGRIENNLVTDPYSVNLSQNSRLSQIVNLDDPALQPEGWETLTKPVLEAPEDITVYEVHVRDFSRNDESVDPKDRGKFTAFTYNGKGLPLSNGMRHLQNLAAAGLTHVHLMPAFDYASVDENPQSQSIPDPAFLSSYAPDGNQQQEIVANTRNNDAFNWGYDPYHYGVPEGSYATVQENASRILEFRQMVQALSESGLRVVMDVVYNHTFSYGLYPEAVLDKIVPGYYHRYDNNGYLQNSSCCSDTAVEFAMMQKLMIDTALRWIKDYKVDGLRFDLMNLHTVDSMVALRDRLRALTPDRSSGVNGREIYLYGEGWDFGSAKGKGLVHANQYNLAGTGIGTFNDKIRDALHGGYSGDPNQIHTQGFINGQAYDWNGYFYERRFRNNLRANADKIRIALAGSLQSYELVDQRDNTIVGKSLDGVGYTRDPQESVNYISKHDNETLYDLNAFKLPYGHGGMAVTSMEDRVRAQNVGLSAIALAQGIPFFHMGSDMLRSKSLDHNSYNSGDWFNRVDFTYNDNNFGVGLPPAENNQERWSIMAPLLRDAYLKPEKSHIEAAVNHFQEMLKIRKSSKLFRLETAVDIRKRVKFHNTGSLQKDGLIAMSISDRVAPDLDPDYEAVVVLFNANKFGQTILIPEFEGANMVIHPVQANSSDRTVKEAYFQATGEFSVPARTTAVFVLPQN